MRLGAYLVFVGFVTAVSWWLSGYDTQVTGENNRADFIRRGLRTGITLFLATLAALGGFLAVPIIVMIAVIWSGCVSELVARQFHKLVDPEDKRPYDPKEAERKLDHLAQLVREGRTNEALDLCMQLQESGEASALALEATIHRLYQDNLNAAEKSPLLSEVLSLCERDLVEEAESRLKLILAGQPKNWPAMLLLMRVYAEGLSQPQKALALLQPADKQPQLHPAFIKYARQSIDEWGALAQEWSKHSVPDSTSVAVPEELSLDELIKNNQLATAVEFLEKAIAAEPQNFDLRLKLAEVYGVNCADLNRAGKIVQKMEGSSAFTPQEIELAKAKLKDWRAGRR